MKIWLKISLTVVLWLYWLLLVYFNGRRIDAGMEDANAETHPFLHISTTIIIWLLQRRKQNEIKQIRTRKIYVSL